MTPKRSYPIRNYAVGQYLQTLRSRAELTQSELASRIGVNRRSLQKWESGETYPTAENLRTLIEILLTAGAFMPDQERTEAADLWQQVSEGAPQPLPFFDMTRFDQLLTAHSAAPANASVFSLSADQPFTDHSDLPSPPPAFLDPKKNPLEVEPTVFIGRERELSRLNEFLQKTVAGRGQVLFVTGEAGQGKTSLLNEFAHRAQEAQPELIVASGNCDVYTGVGDPYLPFRDVMRMLTADIESQWAAGSISRDHALRLWYLLPHSIQALLDYGPGLIDTFISGRALASRAGSYASEGSDWLSRLQELITRQTTLGRGQGWDQSRIFEEYTEVLEALASRRPLLLILDDLHWADLSSISLLSHLGRRIGERSIFIVGAYRPEEVAQGRDGGQHPLGDILFEFKRNFGNIWIELDRDEPTRGQAFVDALLDSEPNRLGEDFRQELTRRSGGHPLFTVELLRDMQERGDLQLDEHGRWVEGSKLAWDTLPARVEGVIKKRIDRLDNELREILTLASVEGEEFTAEVLARVLEVDERELVRRLSGELDRQHRLVKEQGIQQLGAYRLSRYRFRHNLFQKYLYDSLSTVERAYQHEAVGAELEALYGGQSEKIAVQLARHFQEAGFAGKAIDYLLRAGNQATLLSANEEAITHLNKGLELLKSLPQTPERREQELALHIALGTPLMTVKGYAAPEVRQTYTRALALCKQIGETAQLFPVLWGLWQFYAQMAEWQTAREVAAQLLQLAEQEQDSALLPLAHRALGTTLRWLGELVSAYEHSEQGLTLYNPRHHRSYVLYAEDPGVTCRATAAELLWHLGYPDRALQRNQGALTLAQELSHPLSLAYALLTDIRLRQFRREGQAAQERAEVAITFMTEHGIAIWLMLVRLERAWALAEQGQAEEGITQMRQGLTAWRATESLIGLPILLADAAEVYGKRGQANEGLIMLTEALEIVEKTDERLWEAELYRLKGELLLKVEGGRHDREPELSPEGCFLKAIDIARQQSAKSLELRATVSLCRLWHSQGSQGKKEEARQMLAEIYNWFTEGFDTVDLQEAKALLDELSA